MTDRSKIVTALVLGLAVVAAVAWLGAAAVIEGEAVTGILGSVVGIVAGLFAGPRTGGTGA